jgi:hypothetical protein
VESTCDNEETITKASKQVTVICDFGHSSSSSNLDLNKKLMMSTVVANDTTSDDIGNTGKRGFQCVYQSRKSQASQRRKHTR